MSSIIRFSKANPLRIAVTGWTGANAANRLANDPEFQLFKNFCEPYADIFFQPFLEGSTISIQFDSSFDSTHTVRLREYYSATIQETGNPTEKVDNTSYKVFERDINLAGAGGKYYIEVTGSDADGSTFTARSEPIEVKASWCDVVEITWYNYEIAYGVDYRNPSGITFSMLIPGQFNKIANLNQNEPFTDSGGSRGTVSDITSEARLLETGGLEFPNGIPQWMVEKINLALGHDYCDINGKRVVAENKLPHEYTGKFLFGNPSAIIHLQQSDLRNSHDAGSRQSAN